MSVPRRLLRWLTIGIVAMLTAGVAATTALLSLESLSPLEFPRYTLTNGRQTVIFETMAHVAAPSFYDGVREDIFTAKRQGYTYFYEGVGAKDLDQLAKLPELIANGTVSGISLGELYLFFAYVTGLTTQPQQSFLHLENDADVNADVTLEALIAELKTHASPVPPKRVLKWDEFARMRSDIHGMSDSWKAVMRLLTRNAVSVLFRFAPNALSPIDPKVLVDWRNQVLVDHIATGPEKIVVTYGAGHFPGVLADLQTRDPDWHVEATSTRRVFR